MKIVSLKSANFRHFSKEAEVSFGERMTVISGQNGTGKSSLLGWVAQLCKFDSDIKQVTGVKFEEDWGKIFRFYILKTKPNQLCFLSLKVMGQKFTQNQN